MGTTADKLAKLINTKAAIKSAINGSGDTVGDKFADYSVAITNGKSDIATAITEMGVQTASDATFNTLAANVREIQSGVSIETASVSLNGLSSRKYFMVYYTDGSLNLQVATFNSDVVLQVLKNSVIGVFLSTGGIVQSGGEVEASTAKDAYLVKGDGSISPV